MPRAKVSNECFKALGRFSLSSCAVLMSFFISIYDIGLLEGEEVLKKYPGEMSVVAVRIKRKKSDLEGKEGGDQVAKGGIPLLIASGMPSFWPSHSSWFDLRGGGKSRLGKKVINFRREDFCTGLGFCCVFIGY